MDRQLRALGRDKNHHLERVTRAIWTDDEPAAWVFSGILGGEHRSMAWRMSFVGDAVLAS